MKTFFLLAVAMLTVAGCSDTTTTRKTTYSSEVSEGSLGGPMVDTERRVEKQVEVQEDDD